MFIYFKKCSKMVIFSNSLINCHKILKKTLVKYKTIVVVLGDDVLPPSAVAAGPAAGPAAVASAVAAVACGITIHHF